MEVISGKKIVNIAPIITTRNRERVCKCYDLYYDAKYPSFEFDKVNREMYCRHCGALVDPFFAMEMMAKYWERIEQWEQDKRREIAEMQSYKPWRRAMKSIEQHIGRKGEMLPSCPHCKKGFRLEEVANGVFINENCCENKGWSK